MNNKEKNKFESVDSTGKPFSKNDTNGVNKLKKCIVNNIWNILGIGVGTCITLMSVVNFLASMIFTKNCSQYYGVNVRYFDNPSLIREKIIFLIYAVILIIYPIFLIMFLGNCKVNYL